MTLKTIAHYLIAFLINLLSSFFFLQKKFNVPNRSQKRSHVHSARSKRSDPWSHICVSEPKRRMVKSAKKRKKVTSHTVTVAMIRRTRQANKILQSFSLIDDHSINKKLDRKRKIGTHTTFMRQRFKRIDFSFEYLLKDEKKSHLNFPTSPTPPRRLMFN